LFSPFQEFNLSEIHKIFPKIYKLLDEEKTKKKTESVLKDTSGYRHRKTFQLSTNVIREAKSDLKRASKGDNVLVEKIKKWLALHSGDVDATIKYIEEQFIQANKEVFYPLIVALFRLLGFECNKSRVGVNYERWDAIIIDKLNSIPIEIKSPGEELYISVKAVRQALENKIILLSRKIYSTRKDTTSLVVGFYFPNDRSEVASLIEDIYKTFNIKLGVIDFKTMLRLAIDAIGNGEYPKYNDMMGLYGFIKL
jgi:hypothetical protein